MSLRVKKTNKPEIHIRKRQSSRHGQKRFDNNDIGNAGVRVPKKTSASAR